MSRTVSKPPESSPADALAAEPAAAKAARVWAMHADHEQHWPPGALYIVATPIGNLRDITLRALDCLVRMDAVAAEDTRVAQRLLNAFDIRQKTFALHQHNEAETAQAVITRLSLGERVAFVSDAGTPGISDPGARLVRAVRDAGYRVVPLPGPSALTSALSVSGLSDAPVLFLGFLPAKAGAARRMLASQPAKTVHIVLYEAPHRVRDTLALLSEVYGRKRRVVIARELTKLFETIKVGTLGEGLEAPEASEDTRGEFVIVIEADLSAEDSGEGPDKMLRRLLQSLPLSEAVAIAAEFTGVSRKILYARALALQSPPS
jgi:16S rRNA (cytidine1402-2'-O)-methyltransferase